MKWCFGLFAALLASTAFAADPPAKAKPDPAALARVIDAHVATTLKAHYVPASPRADDATFFRRVNLALAGRVPVPSEVRLFLADTDPNKRAKAIDKLLASAAYANHLTTTWRGWLLPEALTDQQVTIAVPGFEAWLRQRIQSNVPFDQFVQAVSEQVPLKRAGRPEDVAGTIAFLCSDDASYVSGQVIYVAGGPRA